MRSFVCLLAGSLTAGGGQRAVIRPAEDDREERARKRNGRGREVVRCATQGPQKKERRTDKKQRRGDRSLC